MVLSLCAMVNTVRSANSRRMVCWMSSSVSRSTAAVASSRTRTLLLRSSARAKHTNCRWPTLWKGNYGMVWYKCSFNVQSVWSKSMNSIILRSDAIDCYIFCAFLEKETSMEESNFATRKFRGLAYTIVFEATTFRQKFFNTYTAKETPTNQLTNKRVIPEYALMILPPFYLIRDFGKQNTSGNVSKISVSLACYRQIGSKSTNHSH